MLAARPTYTKLDFVTIQDFEQTGVFDGAVKDVDAVIHVASVCPISSYLFSLFGWGSICFKGHADKDGL
jgi:hypothetical protein